MALKTVMTLSTGIEIIDGYSIITSCLCRYIEPKAVEIVLNVYKDKTAFDDGKPEVLQLKYKVTNNDYYTYFDEEALSEGHTTILRQSYEWLKMLDIHSEFIEV